MTTRKRSVEVSEIIRDQGKVFFLLNFIKDLDTTNETELVTENQEEPPLDDLAIIEPEYPVEDANIDKMFKNLTEKEKNLLELMVKFPHKNHTEIADILGVTRQMIEKTIKGIREKYKKEVA